MVTKLLLVLPVAMTTHPAVLEQVGEVARARFGSKHFGIHYNTFVHTAHGHFCTMQVSGNKFGA